MSVETNTSTSNYVLSYEGYTCPEQYVNDFTPQEFEELVETFLKFDSDGSQTVDYFELQKLLADLGADISDGTVQRILGEVDADGSGDIDFGEFVTLHARVRRGDSRLSGLNALAERLKQSPLAVLESQVAERHLKLHYELIEERAATALHPPVFVMEVVLRGVFYDFDAETQTAQRFQGEKRVQGLGRTTRDARVAAAKNALSRMRAAMPGLDFEPGLLPKPWLSWLRSNVRRGVQIEALLKSLRAKGWHPHRHDGVMQYLICCKSLQKLSHWRSAPRVREWVLRMRERGADGICIKEALEDHKMIDDDDDTREFVRVHLQPTPKQPSNSMSFFSCVADGNVEDVELYLVAGQGGNLLGKSFGHTDVDMPALHYAAKFSRKSVVNKLLDAEVDVNARDSRGRTAIMLAALFGHEDVVQILHDRGADLHLGDKSGDTALHLAAFAARDRLLNKLLILEAEMVRKVTSGEVRAFSHNRNLAQVCETEFVLMMDDKLHRSEARVFKKTWVSECAQRCLHQLAPEQRRHLGHVTEGHVHHVLKHFDPNPGSGFMKGETFVAIVSSADDLFILMKEVFRQCGVDMVNRRGWTPLHTACFENKESSHEKVVRMLVDRARTDVCLSDHARRTPFDLLCLRRGRPGTPSGSTVVEDLLVEKREILVRKLEDEAKAAAERRRLREEQERLDVVAREALCLGKQGWKAMRETSQKRRCLNGVVEYEDYDSGVLFYGPEDLLDAFGEQLDDGDDEEESGKGSDNGEEDTAGDEMEKCGGMTLREILRRSVDGYSWSKPRAFRAAECIWHAWATIRRRSFFVRKLGVWDVLRDPFSGVDFYAHGVTDECSISTPTAASWPSIHARSDTTKKLGVAREWHEMLDPDKNVFYFCGAKKGAERYSWRRPVESLEQFPKCCSTSVFGRDAEATQPWYTCDICNQLLKEKLRGGMLKVCLSCARACHSGPGHKVRFVRESAVACNCHDVACQCQRNAFSDQHFFDIFDEEMRNERLKAVESEKTPACLGFVPLYFRENSKRLKRRRGWQICRVAPREHSAVTRLRDLFADSFCAPNSAQLATLGCKTLAPDFVVNDWLPLVDPEICETKMRGEEYPGEERKLIEFASIRKESTAENEAESSNEEMTNEDFQSGSPTHVESYGANVFYFNIISGESRWEIPEVPGEPKAASDEEQEADFWQFPDHDISDWYELAKNTTLRRKWGPYNQYEDDESLTLWYATRDEGNLEYNAMTIQRWYRRYRQSSSADVLWQSRLFRYSTPIDDDSFLQEQVDAVAWAMLRRRSRVVTELTDVEGKVWEELFDPILSEAHYFHETSGVSTWNRPSLPTAPALNKSATALKPLEIGTKVYYTFPGELEPTLCVVTRLREDDETGETCYDVASDKGVKKWRRRNHLTQASKTAEELQIEFETKLWTQQLRRARAAEHRKAQRVKNYQAAIRRVASRGTRERQQRKRWTEKEILEAREVRAAAEASWRLTLKKNREAKDEVQRQELLAIQAGASEAAVAASKTGEGVVSQAARMASASGSVASKGHIEGNSTRRDKAPPNGSPLPKVVNNSVEQSNVDDDNVGLTEAIISKQNQAGRNKLSERDLADLDNLTLEANLAKREDSMTSPRTIRRRRLLRCVQRAMMRQKDKYTLCEWGCGVWTLCGPHQRAHEAQTCAKRVLGCNLGCGVFKTAEEWSKIEDDSGETVRRKHELFDCELRLVPCDRRCGEWVAFKDLEAHLTLKCVKRPFPPLHCRLGCGAVFEGGFNNMLQSEERRLEHERDACSRRMIKCDFVGAGKERCVAMIRADKRKEHVARHVQRMSIFTFGVSGRHSFKVPPNTFQAKLQLWGAGGGSGRCVDLKAGAGGGAAYVEVLLPVTPGEPLEITVGAGGSAGRVKVPNAVPELTEEYSGIAAGGDPGGGVGYGGNEVWAAGGGGGFSMVRRKTPDGKSWCTVAVAGGGGGGASLDGVPGGGTHGEVVNTVLDIRNGRMGTSFAGGEAGDAGDAAGCKWPPSSGSAWQGGHGAEFGGGGGGGSFGGGGGGASPGIVGGGGGGGSYVDEAAAKDYLVIPGSGRMPGGHVDVEIPLAVGIGEWDEVGGFAGEGGKASIHECFDGKNGAVRIRRPGMYDEKILR